MISKETQKMDSRCTFQYCELQPNVLNIVNLNCDTFDSIKIMIDIITIYLWFLKIQGKEQDRTPQLVYTAKYF